MLQKEKKKEKKKNPSCRALSLLFPTWCQGRDVCVAPRVPEPEPRGNVPAAPTGWAGQGRAGGGCGNPWLLPGSPLQSLIPSAEPWGC